MKTTTKIFLSSAGAPMAGEFPEYPDTTGHSTMGESRILAEHGKAIEAAKLNAMEIINCPEQVYPLLLKDVIMPIPATLRAEVEYQVKRYSEAEWSKAHEQDYDAHKKLNNPVRKVVRLVEVESTGILAVGEADYEPAFPEPEKQAIDERVELNLLELARAYANLQKIDYPVHNGHKAAIKAQIREAFYSGYESSQPTPQAESQEADKLKSWLIRYRDDLKKSNVFHKNEAVIREIDELLNPKH